MVVLVVAAQFLLGAFSSLALAAPGVGPEAGWVPNVLVLEAFTILPIGFILSLWGPAWGRWLAAVFGGVSIAVALAASLALAGGGSSAAPFGFPLGFAVLAVPGVVLIACAFVMGRASTPAA